MEETNTNANNGGADGQAQNQNAQSSQSSQANQGSQSAGAAGTQQSSGIDYDKLAGIISGATSAKEDAVLKSYFKQQGLSQDEATQAMQQFKDQKAKNQPDVAALQSQAAQAQLTAQQATVNAAATLEAVGLGIDAKTIPYVLKLADMSQAVGQDGKVSEEAIRNAINKVIEDVPALKPSASEGKGFQVGGNGGGNQNNVNEEALKKAFGVS